MPSGHHKMRQGSPGFPALRVLTNVLGEGLGCTGTQAPPGVWVPQGHSRARLGLLWDSSWQRRPLQACVHPEHRPRPLGNPGHPPAGHFLALALGLCLCLRTSVATKPPPFSTLTTRACCPWCLSHYLELGSFQGIPQPRARGCRDSLTQGVQ